MKQDFELQQREPYPRQGIVNPGFPETFAGPPAPAPVDYANSQVGPSAPPNNPPSLSIVVQPGVASTPHTPHPPQQIGYPAFQQIGSISGALEHLASLNQIFIKQKFELLDAFTGFETNNKYYILDPQGQQILFATEDTDCCTRQCCGPLRPFDMKLLDGNQQEVMLLKRPLACGSCCFPCCLQSIEVQAPPGVAIGTVEQVWSLTIPKYYVKDASGRTVYFIEGPCCTCSCFGFDVAFQIYNETSQQVGLISKYWSGLTKEAFTDADYFGIEFPPEADPYMKAVLTGACMLIDFMYFEHGES